MCRQMVDILFCRKLQCQNGDSELGRMGKGTMWETVQVESASTCVEREADMNDFGLLLSFVKSSKTLSIIFNVLPERKMVSVLLLLLYCLRFVAVFTSRNTGDQTNDFKQLNNVF